MSVDDLPLSGMRIVDFTRLLPGPWCTQVLGDLGGDVIKIEQPEIGDYGRHNPPHYKEGGVYFTGVNRNKRSITLDLTQEDDRVVATRLIDQADILVESFRPDVTRKFGLDYATLAKSKPDLIYCSVNGFGDSGPLARMPGHDLSIQGMSGLMEMRGHEAPPVPTFQTSDYSAAIYATIGILAAVIRRNKTGQGCYLDVPMYDTMMAWSGVTLSSALARIAGFSGEPSLGSFGTNPRYATYLTRDGKAVTVSLLEARTWRLFCEYIGRLDLIYDEGWADRHTTHGGHEAAFRDAISQLCLAHDRDDLAALMAKAGIPICPVYTPDEAVTSPEAKGRDIIAFVQHPIDGSIPYFRDPLQRAGLSDPTRYPAPRLGENSSEIRAEAAAGGTRNCADEHTGAVASHSR
jgi:crotonobetainyl-CoA:carnitine CoA-transferase CaiB-like acyl-CoA transferase